jgi:hypothetical protein
VSALQKLAVEAFRDGCMGEGEAAARARCALADSADEPTQRAYAIIARDEQGHADLGWDILGWALAQGGAAAREAVRQELRNPSEPAASSLESAVEDRGLWRRHGQLGRARKEAIRERVTFEANRRALGLLSLACQ